MKLLVDSNVLIAALATEHLHHLPSIRLIKEVPPADVVIAAHSLAEVYNRLTRGPQPRQPEIMLASIMSLERQFAVYALDARQFTASIAAFARLGGKGPRLYDYLIGQVAALNGIAAIVTWNVRDMAPLFPQLRVDTPPRFLNDPPEQA